MGSRGTSEIAIQVTSLSFEKDPKRARDFNKNAHVCSWHFARFLGGGHPVDGLHKININLGDHPQGEKPYWKCDGVGLFQRPGIDLRAYAKMRLTAKQKFTLDLMRDALVAFAQHGEIDVEAVKLAHQKCMELDYPLDPKFFDKMLAALGS